MCQGVPSRSLPTYFLGDAAHRIVPRQIDAFPVQAVYRAALSEDGLRLLLIMASDDDRMKAGLGVDPAPLGLAWVYDLTPAVLRQPCNPDGRWGLYWSALLGDPWFFRKKALLPKPDVFLELKAGPEEGPFLCCSIGPDSRTALIGMSSGDARTWNLDTGAQIALLRGHTRAVTACAFFAAARADGGSRAAAHLLLTGSADGSARLWSAAGPPLFVLPFPGPAPERPLAIDSLGVSPLGGLLLVAGGGRVALYDCSKCCALDEAPRSAPHSDGGITSASVEPIDAATPERIAAEWSAEQSPSVSVSRQSFSPDCRFVVITTEDRVTVMATPLNHGSDMRFASTAAVCCPLRGEGPAHVAWTPDPSLVMVGLRQGRNLFLKLHGVDL